MNVMTMKSKKKVGFVLTAEITACCHSSENLADGEAAKQLEQ